MIEKSCGNCKKAKIVIGFEEDPICTIRDGIECARKKTWCSWEFNENKVNFVEGGLGAMLGEITDTIPKTKLKFL